MSKRSREFKGSSLATHRGHGASFEQKESIDDSLLPEATELAALKELDGNIIDWVKERTAKEQDSRLEFNKRKMDIIEEGQRKMFTVDVLAIVCAFIIVMAGMGFSYLLIVAGQIITGTIFGGATIFLAASAFLNVRKKPPEQPAKK